LKDIVNEVSAKDVYGGPQGSWQNKAIDSTPSSNTEEFYKIAANKKWAANKKAT
jgi:hypothetical protein